MQSSRALTHTSCFCPQRPVCHQMTRTQCLRSEVRLLAALSEECGTCFDRKESFSWFWAVETSLTRGAGRGKEPIILGGGTGRILCSDDFPRRLPFVLTSRDGQLRVGGSRLGAVTFSRIRVTRSFGLIFTLNRFQGYKTKFLAKHYRSFLFLILL